MIHIILLYISFSAETKSTSVIYATITQNTWHSTEINLMLHPDLQGLSMTYFLTNSERYTKNKKEKHITLDNSSTMLNYTLKNLTSNTWYSFDVELRDNGSNIPGPKLKSPLVWKTEG